MKHQDKLRELLHKNLAVLDQAQSTLLLSYIKCQKIGIKEHYSFEELESFDSLTAKFARTSDLFTQKVLVSIIKFLREEAETFLDRINLAEKLGLISSADHLLAIRDLRNQIAHEYKLENIEELYEDTLELIQPLVDCLELTRKYVAQKCLFKAPPA
jgi:hypothetical protein